MTGGTDASDARCAGPRAGGTHRRPARVHVRGSRRSPTRELDDARQPRRAGAAGRRRRRAGDRVAFLDKNTPEFFELHVRRGEDRRGLGRGQLAAGAGRDRAHRERRPTQVLVVGQEFVPVLDKIERDARDRRDGRPRGRRALAAGRGVRRRGATPPSPTIPGSRRTRRRRGAVLHVGHDRAAQGRDARRPRRVRACCPTSATSRGLDARHRQHGRRCRCSTSPASGWALCGLVQRRAQRPAARRRPRRASSTRSPSGIG